MPARTPGFREDDSWFSEEQLAKCAPADAAEAFRSPVPTQMVSNGEYMPHPQTEKQKRVEARIKDLARSAAKRLGVSRRQFLASTGGMAAAFLAMNEVFGKTFDVTPIEMFEPAAFAGQAPGHFVEDGPDGHAGSSYSSCRRTQDCVAGPSSSRPFGTRSR